MPLLISIVMMSQAQNRETINSNSTVAVSFKIIMTASVTRPCNTRPARPRPRPIFLASDRSCPRTDGLRAHHCQKNYALTDFWCWSRRLPSRVFHATLSHQFSRRPYLACGVWWVTPLSVWPHMFRGAGNEKRTGEQLKWFPGI